MSLPISKTTFGGTFSRPKLVRALIAAALALAVGPLPSASAQQYPSKTITLVVGFAPGGFIDTISRLVGQKLSERLGQPVVVENRAGAGGNLAHRIVAALRQMATPFWLRPLPSR